MNRWIPLLLALMVLLTGCKDIKDSFKPGSFGKTDQEKAMIEAMTEKYGDLTQSGEPRFLEAMMTSRVENFIPVDKVSKYSKDSDKLHAWFVYDNFNEDALQIEWVYLNESFSIHTFQSQTGKDFGRGTFILERPDDGWPLGRYEVIIRGRGIETRLGFEIIDGPTVSKPLEFAGGSVTLPAEAGWYLLGWEYTISKADVTVVEGGRIPQRLMGTTSMMYDYQVGTGEKNNFALSYTRKGESGNVIAHGEMTVTWTDPPPYIAAGDKVSVSVNRKVPSSWGVNKMATSFDQEDIKPGYATAGVLWLVTPDGTNYWEEYSGEVQTSKGVPKGKVGDRRAVIVNLGNSYGYQYYYEWRD